MNFAPRSPFGDTKLFKTLPFQPANIFITASVHVVVKGRNLQLYYGPENLGSHPVVLYDFSGAPAKLDSTRQKLKKYSLFYDTCAQEYNITIMMAVIYGITLQMLPAAFWFLDAATSRNNYSNLPG